MKELADQCDMVLVVGSPNSSNSNRLRELAERMGTPAYLIDGAEDMQRGWFDGVRRIGITAGASAPEVLVRGVIAQLREWGRRRSRNWRGGGEHYLLDAQGTAGQGFVIEIFAHLKKPGLCRALPFLVSAL